MKPGPNSLLSAAAACGALWLSTFFGLWSGAGWAVDLLRVIVTAIVCVVGVLLWDERRRRFLLSPLLHMALLTVLFYSWMPLFAEMLIHAGVPGSGAVENYRTMIAAYPGSRSEVFILGAVILCVGVLLFGISAGERSAGLQGTKLEPAPRALGWIGAAGIFVLAAAVVAVRLSPGLTAFTGAGIGRQIMQATPPLLSFAAACLVFSWADAGRAKVWFGAILVLGGAVGLLAENRAPVSLLIIYGAMTLYLVRGRFRWRRGIALVASGAAVLLGILTFLVLTRPLHPGQPVESRTQLTLQYVTSKLFFRQAMVAGCYRTVAEQGLGRGEKGNSLYFMVALVPRILWPGKPNLSQGGRYAEICGEHGAIKSGQSESITLLGEPILEAGLSGLAVAEITLIALLSGATFLGLARGPVWTIMLIALFPWLINVEQHFALYIGNLFKMGLVMLPFVFMLNWLWPRLGSISSHISVKYTPSPPQLARNEQSVPRPRLGKG